MLRRDGFPILDFNAKASERVRPGFPADFWCEAGVVIRETPHALTFVAIPLMINQAEENAKVQEDGRQHELARHLRVGNLQRAAVGAMHRFAQAVRGASLQDIMRAVEVAGVHLQPERRARWAQEQKASEQLIIVKLRLNSLVGQ